MAERAAARQIEVPAELVRLMHEKSEALQLPWDATLDNEQALNLVQLKQTVSPLLSSFQR